MQELQNALAEFIEKELTKLQDEGLVRFPDELTLLVAANRIAMKFVMERPEYRSGRRAIDRLRDVLWRSLRWK